MFLANQALSFQPCDASQACASSWITVQFVKIVGFKRIRSCGYLRDLFQADTQIFDPGPEPEITGRQWPKNKKLDSSRTRKVSSVETPFAWMP